MMIIYGPKIGDVESELISKPACVAVSAVV